MMIKLQAPQKHLIILFILLLTSYLDSYGQFLVPKHAIWKYLDDGSNQGTEWRDIGFDDASWNEGPAPLGYGDGNEATVLSFGNNSNDKHITYYFRHKFEVINPITTPNIMVKILRDDGAIVYLNGTEIVRSNMNDGEVSFTSLAQSSVSGNEEHTYYEYLLPSDQLIQGDNQLAVEIHQRSNSSSDIGFDFELSKTNEQIPLVRKSAYLVFTGVNTEMKVNWQLSKTIDCEVLWGTDTSYDLGSVVSVEYGSDHQHSYTFTNLDLETKYYYKIISETDTVTGFFRTAPHEHETKLTFFAYGDTRSQPDHHNDIAEQIVTNYMTDENAMSFILSSGDLVNDGDDEKDWDKQFFDPSYEYIQEMFRSLPYMACLGNHEGVGLLFKKYFSYSFYAERCYWSFDYGPAHFTIVDQYDSYDIGSEQYQWIVDDLSSATKPWKFVIFHAPGWSAGGGHSNNATVQEVLQPLFNEYGVQFVITGHNHYYAKAKVDNVIHITTGGGGAPQHNPDPSHPNILKVAKEYHFCKLQIDGDSLRFTAINDMGDIIDDFYYENASVTGITSIHNINNKDNLKIHPNPFKGNAKIELDLEIGRDVIIEVYDMFGRRVKIIENNKFPPGNYSFEWDGDNEDGSRVGAGIYFVKLRTDNIDKTYKLIYMY